MKPSEEVLAAKIKQRLAAGFSKRSIATELGISVNVVFRLGNQECYAAQLVRSSEKRKEKRASMPVGEVCQPSDAALKRKAEAEARMAERPRFDDRTKTGVLMGDPIYQRSALYQKQQQEAPARRFA
jgi:Zn-dependent peptidase ImmA (M78 family)